MAQAGSTPAEHVKSSQGAPLSRRALWGLAQLDELNIVCTKKEDEE